MQKNTTWIMKNNNQKSLKETPSYLMQCKCYFCQQYQKNKFVNQINRRELYFSQIMRKKQVQNSHDIATSDYYFILKKLCIPKKKTVLEPLNLFIPQSCFFINGQPVSLFMNKEIDDSTIKHIKKGLTLTFITKELLYRRRKYKEAIQKKNQKKKKYKKKEVIILSYTNNFHQTFVESEFNNIMNKRKNDPFWKQVFFIQNIISVSNEAQKIIQIRYDHKNIKKKELFDRAKIIMDINAENIIQQCINYISSQDQKQFQDNLKQINLKLFFLYLTYKVVHFVYFFHDEIILTGQFRWAIDDLNHPILINLLQLQHQLDIKYDSTRQTYFNKIYSKAQNILTLKQNHKLCQTNPEKIYKLQQAMNQHYCRIKDKLGIKKPEPIEDQILLSNQAFAKIHPQLKCELSNLVKTVNMKDLMKKFRYQPKKKYSMNSKMIELGFRLFPSRKKQKSTTREELTIQQILDQKLKNIQHRKIVSTAQGSRLLYRKKKFFNNSQISIF